MKLSFFVVTYNQEKYICQSLNSILMQNIIFDYNVVIGEACGSNGTHAICEEYAKKLQHILINNLGIVEWIVLLGKIRCVLEDEKLKDCLEEQINLHKKRLIEYCKSYEIKETAIKKSHAFCLGSFLLKPVYWIKSIFQKK